LALATDDPADVTSSGVDLWYRFTAASNACRLAVSAGTSTDTQIEIENNAGVTMGAIEDATSANGNEIYVYGGLTPGQQYWVAVRNAPGGTPGTFSLCVQSLAASTCDNGPNYAVSAAATRRVGQVLHLTLLHLQVLMSQVTYTLTLLLELLGFHFLSFLLQ